MKLDLPGAGLAHDEGAYGGKTGVSKIGIRTAAGIGEAGVSAIAGSATGIMATTISPDQGGTHGSHHRMEVITAEDGRAAI